MRHKEVWIHGALLVVAMGLAWFVWRGDDPQAREQVTVFDPGAAGVTEIEWSDARNKTLLTLLPER